MSKEDSLNLKSEDLVDDLKIFFSLSEDQITTTFQSITKYGASLTIKKIQDLISKDIDDCATIKRVMLYLIHMIVAHDGKAAFVDELKSIGCDESKAKLFLEQTQILSEKDIETCRRLYQITLYSSRLPILSSFNTNVSHHAVDNNASTIIPIATLALKFRTESETKKISITYTLEALRVFILQLEEDYERVLKEARIFKNSLGDKYILQSD